MLVLSFVVTLVSCLLSNYGQFVALPAVQTLCMVLVKCAEPVHGQPHALWANAVVVADLWQAGHLLVQPLSGLWGAGMQRATHDAPTVAENTSPCVVFEDEELATTLPDASDTGRKANSTISSEGQTVTLAKRVSRGFAYPT